MNLVLKLGLSLYVIMVLGFSAFSEASTSFTDNFLRPVDSQLHLEMTGYFEEGQGGSLHFYDEEGGVYLVSPQCYSNFSAETLELPQQAQISGFLVGTHNSIGNQFVTAAPGVLYIFSIIKH